MVMMEAITRVSAVGLIGLFYEFLFIRGSFYLNEACWFGEINYGRV